MRFAHPLHGLGVDVQLVIYKVRSLTAGRLTRVDTLMRTRLLLAELAPRLLAAQRQLCQETLCVRDDVCAPVRDTHACVCVREGVCCECEFVCMCACVCVRAHVHVRVVHAC